MNVIGLLGNPNTGKTSLFNNLTGEYSYVGNWSGVTVEKKVGILRSKSGQLIDLPGVYSLNPLSKDEAVVTDFLLSEHVDSIVNIIDASQLKRNLHLTVQLLELEKPMVAGLNMIDVAQRRGISIDYSALMNQLKIDVIPIVARTGKGVEQLEQQLNKGGQAIPFQLYYGTKIEKAITDIAVLLKNQHVKARWLAIQFLEGNKRVELEVQKGDSASSIYTVRDRLEKQLSEPIDKAIYKVRDQFIDNIIKNAIEVKTNENKSITEKIDTIVTHPIMGMPIFLAFMLLLFLLTFDGLGNPLADLLDGFISGPLTNILASGLQAIGASVFIQSLILEGIVAGVGGVLVFVPQIFILFFFISFLEDSGYMARVAVVMDRIMEGIGLNGKAFIPMVIGFGCNVPGVMAARTIEQPKERLLTILLTPLMSCSARLPVYALFAGAFFTANQGLVVFSIYLLGILVALFVAKVFSMFFLKNEQSIFVVELPPYRLPQPLSLWRSTWEKGKGFVRKAGTFILGGSVVIWLLSYAGPAGFDVSMDDSFLAAIGGVIAPILAPLGFGTWQAGASLLTGFLAKEVVVSTMNIIYHTSDTDMLQGLLATHYTPLSAFSFMVFILLYVPCLATVATIRKETASRKWTYISIGYALVIAYVISLVIYQVGSLLMY
ncbi:ferrous iron transport protein B [Bacillus sp. HMF5848]|uniref:ferrous iron transport protein B n=1 Tax=Bacillus sp. HMF5848 TaxID=2495421 RepID=UPI000F78A015|nr:ferrous iron transport protein B [Bacillus sp. HMF5848]RSK26444.1 ferrous iron transport protein B [Bacillus sp. HMF5848]